MELNFVWISCFSAAVFSLRSNIMGDGQSKTWQPKTNNIADDYKISSKVLGLGINGKVVECSNRSNGEKYALKVIY